MRNVIVYSVFIVLVTGMGLLSGLTNIPGEWYQSLQKPWFNPPAWVFGPAWTVLYVLIGLAGARIWLKAPSSVAMQIWFAQWALNLLWSPFFFGLESPALGLAVILPMLAMILVFIVKARRIDQMAALLFVPYAGWVAFATVLNVAIFMLN